MFRFGSGLVQVRFRFGFRLISCWLQFRAFLVKFWFMLRFCGPGLVHVRLWYSGLVQVWLFGFTLGYRFEFMLGSGWVPVWLCGFKLCSVFSFWFQSLSRLGFRLGSGLLFAS